MKHKILIYRILQILLLTLYIGLLVFYTMKSLETGVQSSTSSDNVSNITADIIETVTQKPVEQTENFKVAIRKYIGHYGFFIVLGFVSVLLYLSIKELKLIYRILIHFTTGLAYSFMTEFWFQAITTERGPNVNDVGLDFLGFISISFFIALIFYILNYNKTIKANYKTLNA